MPISKAEAQDILQNVRANHAKLEACPLHDFPLTTRFGQVSCTNCGGKTDNLHAMWYRRGLAHGHSSGYRDGQTDAAQEDPQ